MELSPPDAPRRAAHGGSNPKHNVGCAATAVCAPCPKGDKAQGKRRMLGMILVIAALSLIHCQTFGGNDNEDMDCGSSAA